MPSDPILLETMALENGLQLHLYDHSRPVAADRWLLRLSARIDIPVDPVYLEHLGGESISPVEMRAVLGDRVIYERKMERNFVSETDREAIQSEFRRSLTENILKYLSRPEFPGKFILKTYRDACQRRRWRPAAPEGSD